MSRLTFSFLFHKWYLTVSYHFTIRKYEPVVTYGVCGYKSKASVAVFHHIRQVIKAQCSHLYLIQTELLYRTIGTSLLSVFKARRPLKPERKKRDQVRGAALGDQNVRLIVHIARAFHVPVRQESSPTASGMQGRCPLRFRVWLWLENLGAEKVLKTFRIGEGR